MQRYRDDNAGNRDAASVDEEAKNILGDPDHEEGCTIDAGACLIMILDPGVSPAGCQIEDSSASTNEWMEV